jgi:hypothetical protein
MKRLEYKEVVKANFDGGIYRIYIAQNFGAILEFGGLSNRYFSARCHCLKLAKITGKKLETVIQDIREDYRATQDEE